MVKRAHSFASLGVGNMARTSTRRSLVILYLAASLSLAGCAGTDVELKGGVFEAAGLTNIGKKPKEKEMENRPGIVIPPSTASLPPPGATPAPTQVAATGEAFPINPEDRNKMKKSELIAKHEAFCEKSRQRFEQGMTAVLERSPWGECHESIMKNLAGQSLWGNKNVGSE